MNLGEIQHHTAEAHPGIAVWVDIHPVDRTAAWGIVGAENIEVDIETEGPEVQRMEVVGRAVSKLPQAASKVLVKIHNPHLVNRHKWLVEQHMESHSVRCLVSWCDVR